MPDYTQLLSRVALALETIATSPNYYWVAPLAVLVSGVLAYWAAVFTIRKQRQQEDSKNQKKKELVASLLKDEFNLRWKGDIAPYIEGLFTQDTLSGLRSFSRMTSARRPICFKAGKHFIPRVLLP